MSKLIEKTLPLIHIFNISSDVDDFQAWLLKEHGKGLEKYLLHGYKLFLETAFSSFYHELAVDNSFLLTESFLFQCALGKTYYIDKLPSIGKDACEKITLLKNINNLYNPIRKSKSKEELKTAIYSYRDKVLIKFAKFFNTTIQVGDSISFKEGLKLLIIDNLYIGFSQINNNGPTDYNAALFKSFWISKEKLKSCFEGYKYTLQFMWYKILGEDEFRKSSLVNMHSADSWRKYKTYNISRKNSSQITRMFGERFRLNEQTCLDSYFYRIQEEIIRPIEAKFKIEISQARYLYKVVLPKKINRRELFGDLLSVANAKELFIKLTTEEKIEMQLYWYPVEIIDAHKTQLHNGVPAFITAFAGTIALRKNEGEFKKVIVCKFVSSAGKKKNDYSYGILIDSKAAAGHYYSGWLLYYNCCGDYSGFSGSEHRAAETIIKESMEKGLIELRELRVRKTEFRKYVLNNTYNVEREEMEFKETAIQDKENLYKKIKQGKYGELRGLVFELLCYYFANNHYKPQEYEVKWGALEDDSIDLTLVKGNKVIIVECKLNIDNYEWDLIIKSIEKRISRFNNKDVDVDYEFWVWYEPQRYRDELSKTKKEVKIFINGRREKLNFLSPSSLNKLKILLNPCID